MTLATNRKNVKPMLTTIPVMVMVVFPLPATDMASSFRLWGEFPRTNGAVNSISGKHTLRIFISHLLGKVTFVLPTFFSLAPFRRFVFSILRIGLITGCIVFSLGILFATYFHTSPNKKRLLLWVVSADKQPAKGVDFLFYRLFVSKAIIPYMGGIV